MLIACGMMLVDILAETEHLGKQGQVLMTTVLMMMVMKILSNLLNDNLIIRKMKT